MLTQKEWLAKFGQEACNGYFYHNATSGLCSEERSFE